MAWHLVKELFLRLSLVRTTISVKKSVRSHLTQLYGKSYEIQNIFSSVFGFSFMLHIYPKCSFYISGIVWPFTQKYRCDPALLYTEIQLYTKSCFARKHSFAPALLCTEIQLCTSSDLNRNTAVHQL